MVVSSVPLWLSRVTARYSTGGGVSLKRAASVYAMFAHDNAGSGLNFRYASFVVCRDVFSSRVVAAAPSKTP